MEKEGLLGSSLCHTLQVVFDVFQAIRSLFHHHRCPPRSFSFAEGLEPIIRVKCVWA